MPRSPPPCNPHPALTTSASCNHAIMQSPHHARLKSHRQTYTCNRTSALATTSNTLTVMVFASSGGRRCNERTTRAHKPPKRRNKTGGFLEKNYDMFSGPHAPLRAHLASAAPIRSIWRRTISIRLRSSLAEQVFRRGGETPDEETRHLCAEVKPAVLQNSNNTYDYEIAALRNSGSGFGT